MNIENTGRDELDRLARDRFRKVLAWAKALPYYRRRLKGISPSRGARDRSLVPMLSREDLVSSIGRRRFPGPSWIVPGQISFIGLAGGPDQWYLGQRIIPLPLRAVDLERRVRAARLLIEMSGTLRQRTVLLHGIPGNVVHQAIRRALVGLGRAPLELGRGRSRELVRGPLAAYGPATVVTHPSYAFLLRDLQHEEGVELSFHNMFLWGEIGGSVGPMRKKIEEAFGSTVFDMYALQEMGVLAAECPAHQGLHGLEDMFLYEVVDPDTGEVLEDGQRGELVVTELARCALPLVRYRTGDVTSLNRERCDCGRTHLRLEGILGRVREAVESGPVGDTGTGDRGRGMAVPSSKVYPADLAAILHASPHVPGRFRISTTGEVVIETREHREMTAYHLRKAGLPNVDLRFERQVPRFPHRTRYLEDGIYYRSFKEQMGRED